MRSGFSLTNAHTRVSDRKKLKDEGWRESKVTVTLALLRLAVLRVLVLQISDSAG